MSDDGGSIHKYHYTIDKMEEDLKDGLVASKFFLDAQFDEASAFLRETPDYQHSMYLHLASAFIAFIKCFLTIEVPDLEEALGCLTGCLRISQKIMKASRREKRSRLYLHAELVESEALVMRAAVRVMAEPDGMNITPLLKEVFNMRHGYLYYRRMQDELDDPDCTIDDAELRAGVLMGNGMIDIVFSLMPPSIFKIFAFIGYTGDGKAGLQKMTAASEMAGSIRAPLCKIFLLGYYTILTGIFTSNREGTPEGFAVRDRMTWRHLEPCLREHPRSPIFLFFKGRYHFLRKQVGEAIEAYQEAVQCSSDTWPQLQLAIYWDLILGHMRRMEWAPCIEYAHKLATEGLWSRAYCTYLEVMFRDALARESPVHKARTLRKPIAAMLEAIPRLQVRRAGRAFPMERHVATKAESIVAGECRLFLPEYELMSLWDSFAYMDRTCLAKAEGLLQVTLMDVEFGTAEWAMASVALAAVKRTQRAIKGPKGSIEILRSVISYDDTLSKNTCFPQIIPLAHVELAASLLAIGKHDDARVHWKTASGWPRKYYLERSIQARCSKLAASFPRAKAD